MLHSLPLPFFSFFNQYIFHQTVHWHIKKTLYYMVSHLKILSIETHTQSTEVQYSHWPHEHSSHLFLCFNSSTVPAQLAPFLLSIFSKLAVSTHIPHTVNVVLSGRQPGPDQWTATSSFNVVKPSQGKDQCKQRDQIKTRFKYLVLQFLFLHF